MTSAQVRALTISDIGSNVGSDCCLTYRSGPMFLRDRSDKIFDLSAFANLSSVELIYPRYHPVPVLQDLEPGERALYVHTSAPLRYSNSHK